MPSPSHDPTKTDKTDPLAPPAADPTHSRDGESSVPYALGGHTEPQFAAPAFAGEIGTFGRYRVLKKIGQGGMGAVYLGYDAALERKVALKVVLPQYAANASARTRFLREAKSAAKVKSDHVVTIFDVGEEQGIPFIAMEYLLGLPLDQFLKHKGELPLLQVLRIGRETATGLGAAHELGLTHRDVKPANLWLEAPRGRVKILDFGLARLTNDDAQLTGTGAVMGTPAYMSPEQARGLKVDHRSDLFSLGVMLYRLTTGRMPFAGTDAMSMLASLAMDTPAPVRQLNPQLPQALEVLVARMLTKNPAERVQTAQEVADAIRAIEQPPPPSSSSAVLPVVVPVPGPSPSFVVGAQPQNVWEGIDDSQSVPVPMATSAEVDVDTEAEAPPPTTRRRKPPKRPVPKWPIYGSLAVLLLAVVGLAAILMRPAYGNLQILYAPDDVELVIKKDGEVVHDRTKEREFVLRTGSYTIELVDPKPGVKLEQEKFEITKNGTSRVSVKSPPGSLKPPRPPVTTPVTPPVVTPPVIPPTGIEHPLPTEFLAMVPVKPEAVFSLKDLDAAKHVPAAEKYDWQPKELVAVLGSHRQRLPNQVDWLVPSPDGSVVLTTGGYALDVASGRTLDWPSAVGFSPKGDRAWNGNRVWEIAKPKETLAEYPVQGAITAFLTNDAVLAVADDGFVAWKLGPKGPFPLEKIEGVPFKAVVSPDRKYLATVFRDGTCRIFDVAADGKPEKGRALPVFKGAEKDRPPTVPEGKVLVLPHTFGFGEPGTLVTLEPTARAVRVWDVTGAQPVLRHTISQGPEQFVCAAPKGGRVIRAFSGGFEVWSVQGDKPQHYATLTSFGATASNCLSIAVTPDGETIITGHANGAVRFWGAKNKVIFEHTLLDPLPTVHPSYDFSPDGRTAVLYHEDGRPRLWNLADLSPRLLTDVNAGWPVRFRPDGGAFCAGVVRAPGGLQILPASSPFGRPTHEFGGAGMQALRYSPDGKWLAALGGGSQLAIWDVSVPQPKEPFERVPALNTDQWRFTPDGRFLIASDGTNVKVWSMGKSGPTIRFEAPFAGVFFALSPDGTRAVLCRNDGVWHYDVKDGVLKLNRKDPVGNTAWADFSPDSGALLVGGGGPGLKLLHPATGKILHEWPTPRGWPTAGRFHPDGRHVFITNADKTTYILRLPVHVDRRAAEYALSVGGTVRINGDSADIKAAAQLPGTWFAVTSIDLTGSATVTDEGLANFRDCKNLTSLILLKTKVTREAVTAVASTLPQCRVQWDSGLIVPK